MPSNLSRPTEYGYVCSRGGCQAAARQKRKRPRTSSPTVCALSHVSSAPASTTLTPGPEWTSLHRQGRDVLTDLGRRTATGVGRVGAVQRDSGRCREGGGRYPWANHPGVRPPPLRLT
ncbi:hypothetical protein VFPFJ_02831 [Purpureocillium lilacinum]|uniref:Uncharacterized protein n=1 Tax=Purpureocillium lilacinum TaxID=33203 RepID=A0A179HW37_PURLI|nr:hypothetical protein VFPFJ_02831 [Purpureocillium lilacinum]OAQ78588.1 hypothetical protein VFPBJ_06709 [Purpureocillium lilacinum]OAQ93669.1 hypothetical protein VFPFJ_02831 [Purpureocillium lilacinum]